MAQNVTDDFNAELFGDARSDDFIRASAALTVGFSAICRCLSRDLQM